MIRRKSAHDERGRRISILEQWMVEGFLQADTQALLGTAIQRLESAYAKERQDAYLLFDDRRRTKHAMLSRWCLGGVKVTEPPWYPASAGGEYTTYRSFQLSLEGLHYAGLSPLIDDDPSETMEWEQTFTEIGTGGPRFVLLETRNGPPQKQRVAERSVVRAVQAGHAVGRTGYPSFPAPLFPADEHVEQRQRTRVSPKTVDKDKTDYAIQWSYSFESTGPLGGKPGSGPA